MSETQWTIHGREFANCNCSYGCPCQFNALPTQGFAKPPPYGRSMKSISATFGSTGLPAVCIHFPGPVHEGNGTIQLVVDEKAAAR